MRAYIFLVDGIFFFNFFFVGRCTVLRSIIYTDARILFSLYMCILYSRAWHWTSVSSKIDRVYYYNITYTRSMYNDDRIKTISYNLSIVIAIYSNYDKINSYVITSATMRPTRNNLSTNHSYRDDSLNFINR